MTAKKLLIPNLNNSKQVYKRKFGIEEFEIIEREVLSDFNVQNFHESLQNMYYPNSKDIARTANKIQYVKKYANYLGEQILDKRIDSVYICGVIILENWLLNILPRQEQNPSGIAKIFGNEEAGWMCGTGIMETLYDDCEKFVRAGI
jgi:hypothetical protein